VIREAKKVYFKHLFETSENKTKTMWNIINKVTERLKPYLFKINNKEVSIVKTAKTFNNQF
jgi:hypothetical protein